MHRSLTGRKKKWAIEIAACQCRQCLAFLVMELSSARLSCVSSRCPILNCCGSEIRKRQFKKCKVPRSMFGPSSMCWQWQGGDVVSHGITFSCIHMVFLPAIFCYRMWQSHKSIGLSSQSLWQSFGIVSSLIIFRPLTASGPNLFHWVAQPYVFYHSIVFLRFLHPCWNCVAIRGSWEAQRPTSEGGCDMSCMLTADTCASGLVQRTLELADADGLPGIDWLVLTCADLL